MPDRWKAYIVLYNKLENSTCWGKAVRKIMFDKMLGKIPANLHDVYALALEVARWHPDNPKHDGLGWFGPLCALDSFRGKMCAINGRPLRYQSSCPLTKHDQHCRVAGTLMNSWSKAVARKTDTKSLEKAIYEYLLKLYSEYYYASVNNFTEDYQ